MRRADPLSTVTLPSVLCPNVIVSLNNEEVFAH